MSRQLSNLIISPMNWKMRLKVSRNKAKTGALRLNSIMRRLNDSSSQTDDNEMKIWKTIVLEPNDLIFTIRQEKIDDIFPNLVFEWKDSQGYIKTHYLYLNQSFKPFLIYLWSNFEVIIYSQLKISLLKQLLLQIESLWPGLHFSSVFGSNSWIDIQLFSPEFHKGQKAPSGDINSLSLDEDNKLNTINLK